MTRRYNKSAPPERWPETSRNAWQAVLKARGRPPYRARLEQALGRYIAFLEASDRSVGTMPTPDLMAEYHRFLLASHSQRRASDLYSLLFYALREMHPEVNWSWLRIAWLKDVRARRQQMKKARAPRHHLAIPVEDWPSQHRLEWRDRFPLDDSSPDSESGDQFWEKSTRTRVERAYGYYLHAVRAASLPDAVTSKGVRCLVQAAKNRGCLTSTIASYVGGVYEAMCLLEPDHNFRWLLQSVNILKKLAKQEGRKRNHGRTVDPAELWMLGLDYIEMARTLRRDDHKAALLFRTGLFTVMLASIPVRLSSIAATRIGRELDLANGYLCYDEDQTKEDERDVREIPSRLLALIKEWIEIYRPRLCREGNCSALWVSDQGGPVTSGHLSKAVGDATEAAFGRRISAHRFRHCVAQMIKECYPEETDLGSVILNHASTESTRSYDGGASPLQSQRRARVLIDRAATACRRRAVGTGRARRSVGFSPIPSSEAPTGSNGRVGPEFGAESGAVQFPHRGRGPSVESALRAKTGA